ncbi:MAG: hypothetical protein R6V45_05640 [Oceanipulchritudo sp.]
MDTPHPHNRLQSLLCKLQDHLRETVCGARDADADQRLARVDRVTEADTIYRIDRVSEACITAWFNANWPPDLPVEVVMEGSPPLLFPEGIPLGETAWKCLLDPIDGTRNMMYDKRSAWALAGIAPQRGEQNRIGDIVVAAMTEFPSSKAWRSDQLSAIRGEGLNAVAHDLRTGDTAPLSVRPSRAVDCLHAFASVTRFFPDGLGLLGQLEERLWKALYPGSPGGSPIIFNDQYLTTGGQLYELMVGHDRFIADLRPLVFRKCGLQGSLSAHPYDLAGACIAEEAGVIIEDPLDGTPLSVPLDTVSPVAWAGYANEAIASRIRPVLSGLIREMLL